MNDDAFFFTFIGLLFGLPTFIIVLLIFFGPDTEATMNHKLKMKCVEQVEATELCKEIMRK